jgi:hypothetical protein
MVTFVHGFGGGATLTTSPSGVNMENAFLVKGVFLKGKEMDILLFLFRHIIVL